MLLSQSYRLGRSSKESTARDLPESLQNTWWRHQMETYSALLSICARNSPVPGEFPTQRPVTRSFDVFSDLRLNIRVGKRSRGWWFETLSRSLWRHRNDITVSVPVSVDLCCLSPRQDDASNAKKTLLLSRLHHHMRWAANITPVTLFTNVV